MIETVLLIILCSLLDRYRGDKIHIAYSRTVEKLLYGLAIATLAGLQLYVAIPFSILWAVGSSMGWGTPIGAYFAKTDMTPEYESWQFGVFKRNTTLALLLRGFIWALPTAPLAYFNLSILYFLPLCSIGFLLALFLVRVKVKIVSNVDRWAQQEYIRGLIYGIGAFLISLI